MDTGKYKVEQINENTYCLVDKGIIKDVGSVSYLYQKIEKCRENE